MDMIHSILKWLDYNRYAVIGTLIAMALSVGIVGCQPKTSSLIDPNQQVTATELAKEVATIQSQLDARASSIVKQSADLESDIAAVNAKVEVAAADIEQQIALRNQIIEAVGGLGTAIATGGFSAPAAIGTITQLLLVGFAGGAGVDILRKNKVIRNLKNGDAVV